MSAMALAPALVGCSDKDRKPQKIKKLQGIASKIDLKNGVVAMSINDEKGGTHEVPGTVREDTEVLINGRIQRLEDVRIGDKVTVYGFREKSPEGDRLVASKVEVERPMEKDWKSTPQAAGAKTPAANPAAAEPSGPSAKKP